MIIDLINMVGGFVKKEKAVVIKEDWRELFFSGG